MLNRRQHDQIVWRKVQQMERKGKEKRREQIPCSAKWYLVPPIIPVLPFHLESRWEVHLFPKEFTHKPNKKEHYKP
ncbi:MAG: hypothetical protein AAF399_25455, partial [Bacteroidota bacterium]